MKWRDTIAKIRNYVIVFFAGIAAALSTIFYIRRRADKDRDSIGSSESANRRLQETDRELSTRAAETKSEYEEAKDIVNSVRNRTGNINNNNGGK